MNSLRRRIDRFCVLHPNFGIPNLMDAADNAVQSTAGKLGLVLRSVAQFIFGREFPVLAVVAAILLLTASWLLLRHQQVEN